MTSRSETSGTRSWLRLLTKQCTWQYWYGGNRCWSSIHRSNSAWLHWCIPAGFLPGNVRRREVVKVGKGFKGSTFTHPDLTTWLMSWVPSNQSRNGLSCESCGATLNPGELSSSQSHQYNRGRWHHEMSPASHMTGATPRAADMTSLSVSSMEATDSIKVYTGHQAKTRLHKSLMRGTSEKSADLSSRRAPLRSAFNPLTPWQGGPAPRTTAAAWECLVANVTRRASSTWRTSSHTITSGKWLSTTRRAAAFFSTDRYPNTGTPSASMATRRAPKPSNKPITTMAKSPRLSASSPRSDPWATNCPSAVQPNDAQTPPPDMDASLQVTCLWTGRRKSRAAKGSAPRNRRTSKRQSDGTTCRLAVFEWLNDSMWAQTAFKQPNKGRRNIVK